MKTLYSAILMFVAICAATAQDAQRVSNASKKQIEAFFKSKTMVVMDASPISGYNIFINNAVKKYWTITPYEIITSDRFDEIRTDPNTSFIFLSKVRLERDRQEVYYMYMNIVMGANAGNLAGLPELLSIPLAYSGVDENAYVDKLPLMIRFAQVHLNNLKNARRPRKLFNLKSYSSNSRALKDMTLLILEKDLSEEVNTLEKIQKEYPGKVKIVTSDEMAQAIEEKAANTAVLHQVSPGPDDNNGRSYCQIYGTGDAKLYYYNHQNITQRRPAGMLARDFRLICGKWF